MENQHGHKTDFVFNTARTVCIILFLLLNAIGLLVGYSFYQQQFGETNPWMWLFVPDCPLYVLLALFVYFRLVKSETFAFIVACGLVKYGIWTEMVFALHPEYYFAPVLFASTVFLAITHIGMISESALFVPKKIGIDKRGRQMIALAMLWFLLNDFADYVLGTMPHIPTYNLTTVILLTVAMSFLVPLALARFNLADNNIVKTLRSLFLWKSNN